MNSSIGAKLAKQGRGVTETLAAERAAKDGTAAVEADGIALARERLLAAATGQTGRGEHKNAKQLAAERAEWDKLQADWRKACDACEKYSLDVARFRLQGFELPYYRFPPPPPGPAPAPFVSKADQNRAANEARAAANRLAAASRGGLNSCTYSATALAGGGTGAAMVLELARKRDEAVTMRLTKEAKTNRRNRLRGWLYRLLFWVRSIRNRYNEDGSKTAPGSADILFEHSRRMFSDPLVSVNGREKHRNYMLFLSSPLGTPAVPRNLSLLGCKLTVLATSTNTTLHFSNLPGPFNKGELQGNVLKWFKQLLGTAAPDLIPAGRRMHEFERVNVPIRNDTGKSAGFAIAQLSTPKLTAAILVWLQENDDLLELTVRCIDGSTRKSKLKVAFAVQQKRLTVAEARAKEEEVREARRAEFHRRVDAERAEVLRLRAEKLAAEKEFKDSFVALPDAPVIAPVVRVGPSILEQLRDASLRPVAPLPPANVATGQEWVRLESTGMPVVMDKLTIAATDAVVAAWTAPEPKPWLPTEEEVLTNPSFECERAYAVSLGCGPVLAGQVNGWNEWISVEEAQEREEAKAAAAATKAAVAAAKAKVLARAAVVTPKGKNAVLSAFFGRRA